MVNVIEQNEKSVESLSSLEGNTMIRACYL